MKKLLYHLRRIPYYRRVWTEAAELRKAGLLRRSRVSVVGASDDLVTWSPLLRLGLLDVCAFEPSADERAKLQARSPKCLVLPCAVGASNGPARFHHAVSSDCSSLLEPDMEVLEPFGAVAKFPIHSTEELSCRTLDSLLDSGEMPQPDYLQMDVQGAEFSVLCGAEKVLESVVAIHLETHIFPIYKSEKPLADVCAWLREKGFVMVHLEQQGSFGGESVEFNATFLRLLKFDESASIRLQKFFLAALELPAHARGNRKGLQAFQ